MLLLCRKTNDKIRQKDEITEHTLSIRLVHCGKHSHETSLVSKKSSLISKKLTALYGKPKIKVNANTPIGRVESNANTPIGRVESNETASLIVCVDTNSIILGLGLSSVSLDPGISRLITVDPV